MGKILTIRVSATTYDEKDVAKAYPRLCALAWDPDDKYILASQTFGLLELIDSLHQALSFAKWSEQTKDTLSDDIKKIFEMKQKLENHIRTWEVAEANALSFTIEECLQELEIKAKL